MKSLELKAIAALAAALAAVASCSRVADDCQLNVTCPGDGMKAGSGGQGGGGGNGTSTSTGTSTSASAGTGGAAPLCDVGVASSCYDGSPGTANVGACKSGMHLCMPDGSSYGACMNQVLPSAENCLEPADEDCDGKALGCTGSTLNGGSFGTIPTDEVIFAVATDPSGNLFVGGVNGATPSAGKGFAMASGAGSVVKFLKNGTMSWSASIKSSVASSYSVVRGLATDKQGNVFVVGELQGTMSVGAIDVVAELARRCLLGREVIDGASLFRLERDHQLVWIFAPERALHRIDDELRLRDSAALGSQLEFLLEQRIHADRHSHG